LKKRPKSLIFPDKIIKINPENPDFDLIGIAARIIKDGGAVVFPTRSLYGLGADAFNTEAVRKVFSIKQRPLNKPVSILVGCREDVFTLVNHVPKKALMIMDCFWPGRITIVFEAKAFLPNNLTAKTGKIGIRIPENNAAVALVKKVGKPITATSANLSGHAGCSNIKKLNSDIFHKVDFILDSGQLKGKTGSTIIDVTKEPIEVLRQGELTSREIFESI